MPELPEMEALGERLAAALSGAKLSRLDLMQFSALKTVMPQPPALHGLQLEGVTRRGKYLLLGFGSLRLAMHLSQGGRVDLEQPPKRTRPKGSVARLTFDNDTSILVKEYGTERKAALWVLASEDEGPLAGLGPEPFSRQFKELIRTTKDRRRLHTFLRDQRTVAGIGRGYADEILNHAALSPFESAGALGSKERQRLIESVEHMLKEGLEKERQRTGGLPAKLSDRWTVHGKTGSPCPRCGANLRRVSYESHEISYCPNCQTGGKVFADRRLSRLIK